MADFTVVIMRPDLVAEADNIGIAGRACISVVVEADSVEAAINAAAASIILAMRRHGSIVRPEELAPVAVYSGRHMNFLTFEGI